MAEIAAESYPTEYDRPPVYDRPYGGIVKVMENVFKWGMTQAEATPATPESDNNG